MDSGAELLDLLSLYNISASFFIVASHLDGTSVNQLNVNQRRALVTRALNEGHMIGSHTWSHHVFTDQDAPTIITKELVKAEVCVPSSFQLLFQPLSWYVIVIHD
jgi:peptidoglycan/xylan/chitin deacetylase (PgdA/CDA1 family)